MMGLSNPYFAASAACASLLMDFYATNGPPGTKFIRKNVSVATTKILRMPIATRFMIYLANRVNSLIFGHTAAYIGTAVL